MDLRLFRKEKEKNIDFLVLGNEEKDSLNISNQVMSLRLIHPNEKTGCFVGLFFALQMDRDVKFDSFI